MPYPYQIYAIPENCFVDFHTHILPGMDDGSQSLQESLQMIRASAAQGVGGIALTPHFYADRDTPEAFLRRRDKQMRVLYEAYPKAYPLLIPGAEVSYFEGITAMESLRQMRIGQSGCLLLEMPMGKWTNRMVDAIIELQNRPGYTIVLAHIERYIQEQKMDIIHFLLDNEVRMQASAGYFANRWTCRKALHLVEMGVISVLGSDSHNMTNRKPNLGDACAVIVQKSGQSLLNHIMARSRYLIETPTHDINAQPLRSLQEIN